MKKTLLSAAVTAIFSLCALHAGDAEAVTVNAIDGARKAVQVEVPDNPKRVVVLDMAVLDIMDKWGLGDRVVGLSKAATLPYLGKYFDDKNIKNLGTMKEVDLEAMMALRPEVIFISGRLSRQYDKLKTIAPVVLLTTDFELGAVESMKKNAGEVAKIFGKGDIAQQDFAAFEKRIAAIRTKAEGTRAAVGLVTAGHFNMLGNNGRCAMIGAEMGFVNVSGNKKRTAPNGQQPGAGRPGQPGGQPGAQPGAKKPAMDPTHGNEASFELLLKLNPEYVFILDRDSAIGTKGAKIASEIMNNAIVKKTNAAKAGNIVYLDSPSWYLAEGGLTALDRQISDVEKALGLK